MRRPPTERQIEVLRAIYTFQQANGYPPTLREIADLIGIGSLRGVDVHLKPLEAKGYITRTLQVARSIVITPSGLRLLGVDVKESHIIERTVERRVVERVDCSDSIRAVMQAEIERQAKKNNAKGAQYMTGLRDRLIARVRKDLESA